MARHTGTAADEAFSFTFERDSLVIEPGGGRDTVANFQSGLDILVLNGFDTLDTFDDIEPFFTSDQAAGTVTLDVSAAEGGTPGTQTVTFDKTFGIGEGDVFFNTEPDPVFFDNDFVPIPPGGVIPINAPGSAFGPGGAPPHTERLPDEPPPADPPPLPADCNLCNDVVLVPAWD